MVGYIKFKYDKVTKYMANGMGSLHGGAIATWVDGITSLAIFAFDS